MGGSMGSVVGEKLTRLIEYATQVCVCVCVCVCEHERVIFLCPCNPVKKATAFLMKN